MFGAHILVCLGWKTRAQLLAMHGDASILEKIIDQKTRNQEFKEHPDAPGDINAMMFYVLVDLESVAEDEHEDRVSMEVGGETHGEQAPHFIDPIVENSSANLAEHHAMVI